MEDALPHPAQSERSRAQEEAAPAIGVDPMVAMRQIGVDSTSSSLMTLALSALDASHLPCIAFLKGGRALVIDRILPLSRFELRIGDQKTVMDAEALAAIYGGSIIAQRRLAKTTIADHRGPEVSFGSIFWQTMKSPKMLEIFLVAIMSNLFMFALPLFSMAVYDRIIPHKAFETLWALATGIMILLAVDFVSRILRGKIQEDVSHQLSAALQLRLFGRILKTDIESAPKAASAVSSALSTVDGVCHLMPSLVVGLFVDLPFVIGLFVYVGITAHWVVIVPLLSILIIALSSTVLHYRARKAHAASVRDAIARSSLVEESVMAFPVTKVTASRDPLFRSLTKLIASAHDNGSNARSAGHISATVSQTVIQLNTVFALVAGVFVINSGGMTVGALVSAVMLSQRGISPMMSLIGYVAKAASLVEPLGLVKSMANLPSEEQGDASRLVSRIRGQIEFSNVTFRYSQTVAPALSDLTLSIKPGERVGVIGSIGSGKSSLLKLLVRLHQPELGGVLIDGHDVRQYDPEALRRQIAYMPQDCDLFETTIRENIVKGLPYVDEAAFELAVRLSGVFDIVTRNPAGYDLQVGKFGRRLSGGERQAVCLARALVRPAPVLVMDEPTSSMDNQMERTLIDRLGQAIGERTFIVATHRAPLLSLVNRVIWLEQGKIIADGSPAEVIARASRAA